jgi:alkanesulfonate monooxygenase SsuD/methylene tetrahydromethanopterin reductase-like flavin-dependent oxidoreductase (luciferase family)
MTALLDDRLVDTIAVCGTPEECAAEIKRRFGDVASRVCGYFPGYDVDLGHVRDLVAALG